MHAGWVFCERTTSRGSADTTTDVSELLGSLSHQDYRTISIEIALFPFIFISPNSLVFS